MSNYNSGYADSSMSVSVDKVLRNTYLLLSMTLLFSAFVSYMTMGISPVAGLICMLVALGVLFLLKATCESAAGILVMFLFTGLMGAGIAPTINHYAVNVGPDVIYQALGATAFIFFTLSAYVLTTKKDFSFMGGFLFIGLLVMVVAGIANIFFAIPALSLALSAAGVLIFSGYILYDTSRIIHGGETNYIMAAAGLYLNILNLFLDLLHLLAAFSGDD
ncbi:MAG: BAX inhibitor (BI)-1/YccA family protein [Planctomycetes bacterium]|nr:BAX inhibitor (BI)-1/YccA family protein [Planctomycetota bacterium]